MTRPAMAGSGMPMPKSAGHDVASARVAWERLVAAAPPVWVLAHCRAVERLATAMAQAAVRAGLAVDEACVAQGALLHDIGRSMTQDVSHASVGAALLRAEGWPEPVVLCVERHTGAGIEPHEAATLGIPVQDYTPQSLAERIVAHADNLYSGERRLTLSQVGEKYRAKGLASAAAKIEALHKALERALGVDLDRLPPVPREAFL